LDNVNIILAAGAQTRWNSTEGKGLPDIKQLVDIDGEILIKRIQRQFPSSIVITKSKIISGHSEMVFNPEFNETTLSTLFCTHKLWKDWTTILLGDVLYGYDTIEKLLDQKEELMFYGNNKEIFVIKFHKNMMIEMLMAINTIINSKFFENKFGKLWNLYRFFNGKDFRVHEIDKFFTFVYDCRDFDTKAQYVKYAKEQKIRK
jgi:choline kinase